MSRETRSALARRQRAVTAAAWRALTEPIRAQTGFDLRARAIWVGLGGLALGFELGRRGRRWLEDAREQRAEAEISRRPGA